MTTATDFFKNFHVNPVSPALIGVMGRQDATQRFAELFGMSWKKTPVKGVWFIGIPGCQFTMIESPEKEMEFSYYSYDTIAQFKEAFENKTHFFNATYFHLYEGTVKYKYPCLRIIKFMQEQGLWSIFFKE